MEETLDNNLTILLTKLTQTIDSLQDFLQVNPVLYKQIQTQFNILISKYTALLSNVTPTLKSLLVHPISADPNDPDMVARVLLRTKLIPEIQDHLNNLLDDDVKNVNQLDETLINELVIVWKNKLEAHDQLVDSCYNTFENLLQEYDFKQRIVDEIDSPDTDVDMNSVDLADDPVDRLIDKDVAKIELERIFYIMYQGN